MLKLYLKALVFCCTVVAIPGVYAQQADTSLLYNTNGSLRVDTNYKITLAQLTKWKAVEDSFAAEFLRYLVYPELLWKNNIGGTSIVSFTIDSLGRYNDFRIEIINARKGDWKLKQSTEDFEYLSEITRSLRHCTSYFPGKLKLPGPKAARYYLPVYFNNHHAEEDSRFVKDGWMTYWVKSFPIIEEKEFYIVPKEKISY